MCIIHTVFGKKGTSRDKTTQSSEEIKPVALSIVELRLAEGISWLVSWLVSYSETSLIRCPLEQENCVGLVRMPDY